MKLPPGAMLGKTYRVTRWIGGGGMGDVYEVTHQRLAGRYAAKVLSGDFASHPDAFSRFRREAMMTSGLRHPGIVQVIDFDRADEGHPYMVMELLEGQELATLIAESAPMGLRRTLGLVEQIGSALEAAHRQGIVHRDLKPQNVFVSPLERGRELVKILDFGISKALVETQKLTRTAAVIGTPHYMAPEQATGRGAEVDARADQFALAAIAYELLSGQLAFAGDSVLAIIYQVVHVDPPPLTSIAPQVPAAVDAVIRRGLAKEPTARYRDIGEFIAALFAAAGDAAPAHDGSGESATETREAPAAIAADSGHTRKFPTTLSSSAAQAHSAPRQGRRVFVWLLVAAGLSAAGVVIGILGVRGPGNTDEPAGATEQAGATEKPSEHRQAVTQPAGSASSAVSPTLTKPTSHAEPTRQVEIDAGAATDEEGTTNDAEQPALDDAHASQERPKREQRRKRTPAKTGTARAAPDRIPRDELVKDL